MPGSTVKDSSPVDQGAVNCLSSSCMVRSSVFGSLQSRLRTRRSFTLEMTMSDTVLPAPWPIGPPPGRAFTWLTRILQAASFVLVAVWVGLHLGGLRLSPRDLGGGANDTSQLFNWHPVLVTLAFPVIMGEAVLSYKAPLLALPERPQKKAWHFALQTAAGACMVPGVVAAFKSHTLKKPQPLPNLYSPHSYLGMLVFILFIAQYAIGFSAFIFPKVSLANRRALGPLHIFLGKAIFTTGIATMLVGIQEKVTLIQLIQKPSVYAPIIRLPAILQLVLVLTAMAVLYHHVLPPLPATQPEVGTAEAVPQHVIESEPLFSSHHSE